MNSLLIGIVCFAVGCFFIGYLLGTIKFFKIENNNNNTLTDADIRFIKRLGKGGGN